MWSDPYQHSIRTLTDHKTIYINMLEIYSRTYVMRQWVLPVKQNACRNYACVTCAVRPSYSNKRMQNEDCIRWFGSRTGSTSPLQKRWSPTAHATLPLRSSLGLRPIPPPAPHLLCSLPLELAAAPCSPSRRGASASGELELACAGGRWRGAPGGERAAFAGAPHHRPPSLLSLRHRAAPPRQGFFSRPVPWNWRGPVPVYRSSLTGNRYQSNSNSNSKC